MLNHLVENVAVGCVAIRLYSVNLAMLQELRMRNLQKLLYGYRL